MITLFASDARLQYTKDVFSVLALPRGSSFQFRYESRYIEPNAKELLKEGKIDNLKAIVAFKSTFQADRTKSFCVPIRFVTIVSVSCTADVYKINYVVDGYPSVSSDYRVNSFSDINKYAVEIFDKFEQKDYTVCYDMLPKIELADQVETDDKDWREICRMMSMIPEYKSYHFIKCSLPYINTLNDAGSGEKKYLSKKGIYYKFVENKCINIDVDYYAEQYDPNKVTGIEVVIDEKILGKTKGLKTTFLSRYGTKKVGFQTLKTPNNSISEIVINATSTNDNEIDTELIYPIIICKEQGSIVLRVVLAAVGALFISLPGIIKDILPLHFSILSAVLGIILVGITNLIAAKE